MSERTWTRVSRPLVALGSAAALVASGLAFAPGAKAAPAVTFDTAQSIVSSNAPAVTADSVQSAAPSNALRSRLVKINQNLLPSANADGSQRVEFDLFPDAKISGNFTSKTSILNMDAWSGSLDSKLGYFYVTRSGSTVLMHIASPKGVYEVSSVGGDVYRVYQVDPKKEKEDAPGTLKIGTPVKDAAKDAKADARGQIDVMVVYTPKALAGEGSTAAMNARIAMAVQETNQSYVNSGITTKLRLVNITPVSYTESGSFDTDLARLANPRDGYMDNVHTIRQQVRADAVSMIIENTDYCGLADAIMATTATAFTTVSRICATGYYSYGHELGHLQGARHDVYVDPTNTPYAYGHGYTYPAAGWRTIMAYNDACADVGVNCTRLQYWSNPGKTFNGRPTGTSATQNWMVLNNTAYTAANWMSAAVTPATTYSATLTPAAASAMVNSTVSLTAAVKTNTGAAATTGSVKFTVTGKNPRTVTVPVSAGKAVLSYKGTVAGVDNVTACYMAAGATTCAASATGKVTWTTSTPVTTYSVTLAGASGSKAVGSTASITASVANNSGQAAAGSVKFTVTGKNPRTVTVALVGGKASLSYKGAVAGVDNVTACYLPAGATACKATSTGSITWTTGTTPPPPATVKTYTYLVQVDLYNPIVKGNAKATAYLKKLVASLDDDGVLKHREDVGICGPSATCLRYRTQTQFVTVTIKSTTVPTKSQIAAQVNRLTKKPLSPLHTTAKVSTVNGPITMAWILDTQHGASKMRPWGPKYNLVQTYLGRQ